MSHLKNIFSEIRSTLNDWLYDHNGFRIFLDYLFAALLSTVSALTFSIGFNTFMDLGDLTGSGAGATFQKILSGGVSGISQVITLIFQLCGWKSIAEGGTLDEHTSYAVLYLILNIPLIILAWFGIGKRFSILTFFNVIETSIFIRLFTIGNVPFFGLIAQFAAANGGMLSRAIFGGVCAGLSSAIAYKGDFSAGGIDVLAYYIALKKRTLVGKYSVIINSVTLVLFAALSITESGWDDMDVAANYVGGAFFTAIYLFVTKIVVDAINIRNKKMKVEVVTTNPDLGNILIESLPHAATMIKAQGVYSGKEKFMFVMVVSSYELPDLMRIIKAKDPGSFVQVIPLLQVAGRFFTKPIK